MKKAGKRALSLGLCLALVLSVLTLGMISFAAPPDGASLDAVVITQVFEYGQEAIAVAIDLGEEKTVTLTSLPTESFSVTARTTFEGAVKYEGERTVTSAYLSATEDAGTPALTGRYLILELKHGFELTLVEDGEQATTLTYEGRNKSLDLEYVITVEAAVEGTGLVADGVYANPAGPSGVRNRVVDEFEDGEHEGLHYKLYSPDSAAGDASKPMVLWLHGGGEGTYKNAEGEEVYSGAQILANMGGVGWVEAARADPNLDAYVLAPQGDIKGTMTAGGWDWGSTKTDDARIDALLKDLIADEDLFIDEARIYVSGCSNGGAQTLSQLIYSENTAGAVPFAGAIVDCPSLSYFREGVDRLISDAELASIKGIPLWFYQAEDDPTVRQPSTWNTIEALKQLDVREVLYTHPDQVDGVENDGDNDYNDHWIWLRPLQNLPEVLGNYEDPDVTTELVGGVTTPTSGTVKPIDWLFGKTSETATVTFDINGGTGAVAAQTVRVGGRVGAVTPPTKAGSLFASWNLGTVNGGVFDVDADPVTGDVTLVATWTVVEGGKFGVTFNSQGGSFVQAAEVTAAATVTEPAAPTRHGYTFDGWYTDAAGTTPWDFVDTVDTADTVLYAKWLQNYPVKYLLDIPARELEHGMELVYKTEGETEELPAPTRDGYDFVAWSGDDGRLHDASDVVAITGPAAFTARWRLQPETPDDLTSIVVNAAVHGDGQKIETIVITVDDPEILEDELTVEDFVLEGHTSAWDGKFVGADFADPMAYRQSNIVPFAFEVTDVAVEEDTVTISVAPHVTTDQDTANEETDVNYKLYYVQDYTLTCAALPALSFTNQQTPTSYGSFDNSAVTVVTPTADEFVYVKTVKSGADVTDFNYFLYTPSDPDAVAPLPLVLSNHGSGDHMSTLANRVALAWAEQDVQAAYVLSPVYPQMPNNSAVSTGEIQDEVIVKTIALIEEMIGDGLVDPDRVYIEGKSMGGGNTIKIAHLHPDFFAAMMPLCGTAAANQAGTYTYADVAAVLKDLPAWFIVGEKDPLVVESQNYYDALVAAGSYKAKLTKYTPEEMLAHGIEKPHDNEIMSMEDPRHFAWMFAQKRGGINSNIDYIRVNTHTPPRGHTIDTLEIYVNDEDALDGIDAPADFVGSKITGNTYNYSSRQLSSGEYRTDTTVPFEATITGVAVDGKKLTLTLAPIKGYLTPGDPASGVDETFGGFKKYYYVKDFTVKSANGEIDFTIDREKAGDTTAAVADDFVQVSAKNEGEFDYYLYSPEGTVAYDGSNVTGIEPKPLVLVMHGSGDQGVLYANRMAVAFAEEDANPAYVLAPVYTTQNESVPDAGDAIENQWVTTEQSIALIQRMIDRGLVDPKRVYLIGKSMGGKNVQRTYAAYSDFFAAAVSLSGSIAQEFVDDPDSTSVTAEDVDADFAALLAGKPFAIIHSVGDPLNSSDTTENGGKTTQSRALRDAILAAAGKTLEEAAPMFWFKEYQSTELTSEDVDVKPHDVEILCMEGDDFAALTGWLFTKQTTVTVTFNANGGSAVASQEVPYGGTLATPLPTPTRTNATFNHWYTTNSATPFDAAQILYEDVTLTANWTVSSSSSGGSPVTTYRVTFNSQGGSAVTAQTVTSGRAATKPADPTREGYTFDGWYTDAAGTTAYNFSTLVTASITLYAKWTADDGTDTTPNETPFADVAGHWGYEDIEYAYKAGWMNGTSANKFSPDIRTERGMIVTVLWRIEGSPAPTAAAPFDDVEAGAYYAQAVAWAAEHDVVNGVGGGLFAPLRQVTREQVATILYRYAQYKQYDVSAQGDLSAFPDATSVSGY
ncbi:MAG: InlB B-repeat-containing protein, partial [Oscillospiraceae bacterium]|nr:InlB B-repeat-containing protein [Oscillospiraceae bacterium]